MARASVLSFDCYGTLIDWEEGIKNAFRAILDRKKSRIDVETLLRSWAEIEFDLIRGRYQPYKEILKSSLSLALRRLGIAYQDDDGRIFVSSVPTWRPFDDVRTAMRRLREISQTAIISNIDNDIIEETVKKIGVRFDYIITAEDAGAYKPSPKIFRHALRVLRVPRDQILHTSFSFKYDLEPAKKLGFRTVWLKRRNEKDAPGKADFEIDELSALLDIVR